MIAECEAFEDEELFADFDVAPPALDDSNEVLMTDGVAPCPACEGFGSEPGRRHNMQSMCAVCDGVGFFGIDPAQPTPAVRGSRLKLGVIAARYRAGVELFHPADGC